MTDFSRLSDLWQGILCLAMMLAIYLLLHMLLRCLQLGRRPQAAWIGVLIGAAFALLQIMFMNAYRNPYYPKGIHLKTVPVAAAIALLLAACAAGEARLARYSQSRISAMSVKEAFDSLPAGLCYYMPGGLIKLVNARMDALCQQAIDSQLLDPEGFWSSLSESRLPGILQGGEAPVLQLADGGVWSFRHRALNTEIGTVHELLAVDVSVDWAKSRELAEKQEKARELNARLKALLEGIEYLTMNRELMQLKTRVHDELGQSLLLSKRYLAQPGSVDGKAVKDAWLSGLRLLENSQPESWQAPYFVQKKQAETLGLQLEIEGSLPLEESLIPVVETALSVHLTNVLRHAGGHTAKACCVREDGGYRLSLTNDGKPPAGTIREGGGLSNLRSLAETQGGRMEVSSSPAFRLTIWLPAGTKEDL